MIIMFSMYLFTYLFLVICTAWECFKLSCYMLILGCLEPRTAILLIGSVCFYLQAKFATRTPTIDVRRFVLTLVSMLYQASWQGIPGKHTTTYQGNMLQATYLPALACLLTFSACLTAKQATKQAARQAAITYYRSRKLSSRNLVPKIIFQEFSPENYLPGK